MASKPKPVLNVDFTVAGKTVQASFVLEQPNLADIGKIKQGIGILGTNVQADAGTGKVTATFINDIKFVTALDSLSTSGTTFQLVPSKTKIKQALKNTVAIGR